MGASKNSFLEDFPAEEDHSSHWENTAAVRAVCLRVCSWLFVRVCSLRSAALPSPNLGAPRRASSAEPKVPSAGRLAELHPAGHRGTWFFHLFTRARSIYLYICYLREQVRVWSERMSAMHISRLLYGAPFQAQQKRPFSNSQLDGPASGSRLKRSTFLSPLSFPFPPSPPQFSLLFFLRRQALKQADAHARTHAHLAVPLRRRCCLSPRFVCISPASLCVRCQAMRSVPTLKYHMNCTT